MITNYDKVVMKKVPPGFKKGAIFEVVGVSSGEGVLLKTQLGGLLMSFKYFDEYFALAEHVWSEWTDGYNNSFGAFQYKTNRKVVKVRLGEKVAEAKCHPDDTFNLEIGMNLALARCYEQLLKGD